MGRLVRVQRRHRPEGAHARGHHSAFGERPYVPSTCGGIGLQGRVRARRLERLGRVLGVVRRRKTRAVAGGGHRGEERRQAVRQHGGERRVQH